MKFPSKLAFASLIAAAALTTEARASWELVSGAAMIHHNTGDALVEGLPATKTVNLAGDTVTALATCSGQVRKQIIGTGATAIVTTQTYDAKGNLLSRRDATNAGTNFVYDELGRKTIETDAQIAGKVRSYTYDAANRLITATDPLGIVTTYGYDLRDRKISDSTPMSSTETRLIQYGFDGRGHMTTLTDSNNAVTTWGYDNAGRQISKLYANGDHRTMAYDAAGRIVTLTDENGHDITSVYDLAGRMTSKHYAADNTDDAFVYDAASRMTSVTKGRYNHTLAYAYDSAGRLASETHPDGTVITQSYDGVNRLANLALTGSAGGSPAYSVDYAFDNRGLLSTVTSGDYATRYEYRTNGQLASTIDSRVNTPQGDILRADRTYDAGARLLSVSNTAANQDQAGVVYTLGLDDQRLTATEESGQKWNYGYDGLKQLATAKKTDTAASVVPPLDQSYGYDTMGNRRTYIDQSGSIAYTANNANQYTAVGGIASTYDGNGNLLSDGVKNYSWDAENQLIGVTPVTATEGSQKVEYTYDWRMRRTAKKSYTYTSGAWALTKTTGFKYHEWNPIEETIVNASTSATQVKNYVWGNDLSGNLHSAGGVSGLLAMRYNGDTYFHAYDGNGNIRAMVKADTANPAASAIAARYAYDGFGKEVSVNGADADKNAFRFSTKQLDAETGMSYYGYRFYSANSGRWVNRDPIDETGGLNLYGMIGNDAIDYVDLFGLVPSDYPGQDGYKNGVAAFERLAAALEAACDSKCCEESKTCSKADACSAEDCKANAKKIGDAILSSWKNTWGNPMPGIPGRPLPPDPNSESCGGYWCFDWSRIFKNAITSSKSKCFNTGEFRIYYKGTGEEGRIPLPGGRIGLKVHYYLEIRACGNSKVEGGVDKCVTRIDDGFAGDTGHVHDSRWPDNWANPKAPVGPKPGGPVTPIKPNPSPIPLL